MSKSFVIYESWATMLYNLPDEQAAKLTKCICAYHLGAEYDTGDETVDAIFSMIRPQLEKDGEKYRAKAERMASVNESKRNRDDIVTKSTRNRDDFVGVSVSVSDSDSVSKERINKRERPADIQAVVDDYNATCRSLPRAKTMSEARIRAIRARLRKYTREDIHKAFELAEQSDFLTGRSGKWGGANIDWLMKEANIAKVLDGNYKNDTNKPRASPANNILHDPRNDELMTKLFGDL